MIDPLLGCLLLKKPDSSDNYLQSVRSEENMTFNYLSESY